MIPIVIEPTNLSFNINNNYKYSTDIEELKAFIEFTKKLKMLFDELEEKKFKIAVTEDLYGLFVSSIPMEVYSDSKGIIKNAVELYTRRFKGLVKVVHKYGDHSYEVNIKRSEIKLEHLLCTEIYLHWLDMCGLIVNKKLLPEVLRAYNISIFREDYAYLTNSQNKNIKINVHDCLESIYNTSSLKAKRISDLMHNSVRLHSIPCKGTGDHSSMWGKSIRKLEDIPSFEREIFTKIIETRLVKSIKFLSFEKNLPSVESPTILINSIQIMTSCDVLMCTLRGEGKKQHCQDIKIEILKGHGKMMADFFENEITLQGLDSLVEPPAAVTIDADLK